MIATRLRLFTSSLLHLQGQADRVNYLMTKQAKIVAMTCTHAALKRREFLQLGLKYDNLLMEESAQILEIETFIPMLLQVCEVALHMAFLHSFARAIRLFVKPQHTNKCDCTKMSTHRLRRYDALQDRVHRLLLLTVFCNTDRMIVHIV